jgi:hypothetical protein
MQNELNSLLYEYVAMDEDGSDVETITFFNSSGIAETNPKAANSRTTTNNRGSNSNSGKNSFQMVTRV